MKINNYLGMAILVTVLAVGCEPLSVTLDLPPDFVAVNENYSDYTVHGISADGVVIGCRIQSDIEKGSEKFWVDAIESNVKARGYKHVSTERIRTDVGDSGKLMRFTLKSEGTTLGYWLAILVDNTTVYIIEAGGKQELLANYEQAIIKSIKSFR